MPNRSRQSPGSHSNPSHRKKWMKCSQWLNYLKMAVKVIPNRYWFVKKIPLKSLNGYTFEMNVYRL